MIIVPIAIVHSLIYRHLTYCSLWSPRLLQPTWIDRQLPFWVWTVWPYAGMVFVSFAPVFVRSPRVFRTAMLGYLLASGMALSFYVLYPTTIERIERPGIPGNVTWVLYRQFADGLGERSCFPSGHIIFPMIGCWAIYRDGRRCWLILAVYVAIASPSILLLKEHVAWDWLGGVICGSLAIGAAEFIRS